MRADTDIKRITEQFAALYKPHKLMLFGSQANGRANSSSDIDLCVIA